MNETNRDGLGLCCLVLMCMTFIYGPVAHADTETAELPQASAVWSSWYWPTLDRRPLDDQDMLNLYDDGEAMSRYDAFTLAQARTWELSYHFGGEVWYGHCHAWSAASIWEPQPTSDKVCGGVTFRLRDLKGLMTEAYYGVGDLSDDDFNLYRPSPGILWRILQDEIRGDMPKRGKPRGIIGNLTTKLGEVWNFPIFKYEVEYSYDSFWQTYSGTMRLWYASDGSRSYADSTNLYDSVRAYPFSGVSFDAQGYPTDSGLWSDWLVSDPENLKHPTLIWRPPPAASWATYCGNTQLEQTNLEQILDIVDLDFALNLTSQNWAKGSYRT